MKNVLFLSLFLLGLVFVSAGSASAQQASVAGEWNGSFETPGGARPFVLILKVDGEKLTGTVKRSSGDVSLEGTIKGKDISFSYTINYNDRALTMFFSGKVDGDKMSGAVSFGGNAEETWSAARAAAKAKP